MEIDGDLKGVFFSSFVEPMQPLQSTWIPKQNGVFVGMFISVWMPSFCLIIKSKCSL